MRSNLTNATRALCITEDMSAASWRPQRFAGLTIKRNPAVGGTQTHAVFTGKVAAWQGFLEGTSARPNPSDVFDGGSTLSFNYQRV